MIECNHKKKIYQLTTIFYVFKYFNCPICKIKEFRLYDKETNKTERNQVRYE